MNIIIFEKCNQNNHIFNSDLCSYLILYNFKYKKSTSFYFDYNKNNFDSEKDYLTKYKILGKNGIIIMYIDVIFEILNDSTIIIICRQNEKCASVGEYDFLYNYFLKKRFRQIL